LPPRYEVILSWTHDMSSTYWVSLLHTSYLSVLWLW